MYVTLIHNYAIGKQVLPETQENFWNAGSKISLMRHLFINNYLNVLHMQIR